MENTKTDLREIFEKFQARNPKPYFKFEEMPASQRLIYEKIDHVNFLEVYQMFKNDDNPFVSDGYRDLKEFRKYVEYQLNYHRFTPKRAACDWLMRLKTTKQCIGLINLFELSKASFGDNPHLCMIGFCTHRDFRRKYYTLEAVTALVNYVFRHFDVSKIVANTKKDNLASKRLLEKMGFQFNTRDFADAHRFNYFELYRGEDY